MSHFEDVHPERKNVAGAHRPSASPVLLYCINVVESETMAII